ncbi:hypothetical protein L3Q82_005591 [Scortum barcoo]|uniref:Uncharacterized protein n=1 Tax=Scortum barcoo TaxID=214431 RepID=A0ACB8V617_9TELE|nr:hypothetical protein L3Q82_005591 [Scortum barcoo]
MNHFHNIYWADRQSLHQSTMKSFAVLLSLVPVLSALSVRVSAAPGCGPCDPAQCAPLPGGGCPAGSLLDSCGCCSVCAAAEGELCGGRRAAVRRCGSGLECVRSDAEKKNKLGVCACKSNYEVCGTDGVTYPSGCALKSASLTAETEGREPVSIQNKGRCASGERLVAGSLPTGPGRAQPEMATWARLPVGSPPAGRSMMRGRCNVVWVAVVAGGLGRTQSLDQNSGNRDMECHLAGGKEPELVREVERYRLEIVGLTSTHSLGSGTQLLERGWTLHYSGVAQGERRRAGVGLLIAPQLSRHVFNSSQEFTR